KAPSGASRMMKPNAANSMCAKLSMPSSTTCPARPIRVRPKPQRTASNSTGRTSPSANAPKKEFGMMCMTNSTKPRAGTRLQQEDRRQPGQQRGNRQGVEEPHRLQQRLADFLRVAERGDAADDGAEDDRRDHHLDELHESVAERLQRRPEFMP